ncbi:hypothetical protein PTH_0591 [Pelotomaculum thermopropionicum SI]|uniref:Mycofactocin n=1 Tax=Pelotomaculum thermopropionicum (strain DSM 13744 / JCM 10971 / SI) TaxID=370438 RepID=A5D4R3_PELTS|nr:hypothetical protein PTH_0591 [Pelotomaculum thermopropionicum SI]
MPEPVAGMFFELFYFNGAHGLPGKESKGGYKFMEQNGDRDMQAGAGRPAEEQETVWEQFVVEDIVIETLAIDGICGVY